VKDALPILAITLLAFPFGMGFSAFLRWMSRQKRDVQSRLGVANAWVWPANWGVLFNLVMAVLHGVEHQMASVGRDLIMMLIFFVMGCGAWSETRRYIQRQ
jgi:hypothetical protein